MFKVYPPTRDVLLYLAVCTSGVLNMHVVCLFFSIFRIITGRDVYFLLISVGNRRAAADEGSRSGCDHGKEATLRLAGSGHRQICSHD